MRNHVTRSGPCNREGRGAPNLGGRMYRYECRCGERVTMTHSVSPAPICWSCFEEMLSVTEAPTEIREPDLTSEQEALERLMREKPGR